LALAAATIGAVPVVLACTGAAVSAHWGHTASTTSQAGAPP